MLPDSPAGRQLGWLLDAMRRAAAGSPPAADDEAAHLAEDAGTGTPAPQSRASFWAWVGARFGSVRLLSVDAATPLEVSGTVVHEDGKAWIVYCRVHGEPPHLVENVGIVPTIPGLVVREATAEDAVTLAEVERRAPMVVAGAAVTVDRGDDYFASARLMERPVVGVAEIDGRAVAVMSANLVSVRIGGVASRRVVPNHVRVIPEYQGTSLWKAISPVVFGPLAPHMDGTVTYVATGNEASQRATESEGRWTVQPVRAVLDTAALAGPAAGRPAAPADVPHVVAVLNDCHEREEGYLPYTIESFEARLARAPAQYALDQVWMHGSAVVGVWPAGDAITLVVDRDGERHEHRRAIVLDHGFTDDASDDLEALLRAWCSLLAARGQDQLALFTSPGARGHELLTGLAAELEPFDVWPTAPEPDDSLERGWYVDATAF